MEEKIVITEKEICDIHHKIDILVDCIFSIFDKYQELEAIRKEIKGDLLTEYETLIDIRYQLEDILDK